MANIASGHPGMTGRLTVRYLQARPRSTGRSSSTAGRRPRRGPTHRGKGELPVDGVLTAEAEGLFVTIDPRLAAEYFGRDVPPDDDGGRAE